MRYPLSALASLVRELESAADLLELAREHQGPWLHPGRTGWGDFTPEQKVRATLVTSSSPSLLCPINISASASLHQQHGLP